MVQTEGWQPMQLQTQPDSASTDALPHVVIITLNYRSAEWTLKCIASLKNLDYPSFQTVVIDNGSHDDSLTLLTPLAEQGDIELIALPENLGFSEGNNVAIRHVLSQTSPERENEVSYIWLLNNDTEVKADSLTHLVEFAEAQKREGKSGIMASQVLHPNGAVQTVGRKMSFWTGNSRNVKKKPGINALPVPNLSGASLFVPVPVFEKIGLLKASYFLYYEDDEFSLRARKHGLETHCLLTSKIYHQLSASSQAKMLPVYYMQRNRLYLISEYGHLVQLLTATTLSFLNIWFYLAKFLISCTFFSGKKDRLRASLMGKFWGVLHFLQGVDGPYPSKASQQTTRAQSSDRPFKTTPA
jgi:hypothetical protein